MGIYAREQMGIPIHIPVANYKLIRRWRVGGCSATTNVAMKLASKHECKQCTVGNITKVGFANVIRRKKNAFNTFDGPQGYTQCILVSNTECKHDFGLFTRHL